MDLITDNLKMMSLTSSDDESLSSHDERFSNWKIPLLRIPLEVIVEATNNFDVNNLLKGGGKADVYKGVLQRWNAKEVEKDVVIRKYRLDHQFNFYEELHKIYVFQEGNFVSFYGFCDDDGERIIVLEFAVNGSLSRYVSDPPLKWSKKLHIFTNVARELILWDKETKIRDFMSYGDYSSDMYCFGAIMLEVLYGRKVTTEDVNRYIDSYEEPKQVDDMIPPHLRKNVEPRSLSIFKEITYKCLKEEPDLQSHKTKLAEAYKYQSIHEHSIYGPKQELSPKMKIPLSDIITATNGFSKKHHFTSHLSDELYEGKLGTSDGEKLVFIKRCNKETSSEHSIIVYIGLLKISDVRNLPVSLLGYCVEDSEIVIVFERDTRDLPKCLDAFSFLETLYLNASVNELPNIPLEDIAITDFDEEKLLKLGGTSDIHVGLLFRWCKQDVIEDVVIWKYVGSKMYDSFPLFWHRNAILIYGCFYEERETMIAMEYPANGSLDDYLSDPVALTWCQRLNICYGVACAFNSWIIKVANMNHYHKLIYPTNKNIKIFLDKDWEAKVLICTEKNPWGGNGNYSFDKSGFGMIMLEMVYCKKITTDDVTQYTDNYEREQQETNINPNLRKQMPQTDPRSLSIFLETTYQCLKKDLDLRNHQIKERLKDAYEDQMEHLYSMF